MGAVIACAASMGLLCVGSPDCNRVAAVCNRGIGRRMRTYFSDEYVTYFSDEYVKYFSDEYVKPLVDIFMFKVIR